MNIDTLAEVQAARPLSHPKPNTRLDRAIAKKAARLADGRALRVWARAVKDRDHWKDRKTGRRVHGRKQLDPDRAEAHHVVAKDDQAVRYDIRNGICLSLATHILVETFKLRIEGTVFFVGANGARYIDATHPVIFVRT